MKDATEDGKDHDDTPLLQEQEEDSRDGRGEAGGGGGGVVAVVSTTADDDDDDADLLEEQLSAAAAKKKDSFAVESLRTQALEEDEEQAVPAADAGPPPLASRLEEAGEEVEVAPVVAPPALLLDEKDDLSNSILTPGYSSSNDLPTPGSGSHGRYYSHGAQPSSDSLPVLPEEEVVEVPSVGAVGLTPLELLDLSSASSVGGGGVGVGGTSMNKNHPTVIGSASSTSFSSSSTKGRSSRGSLSRPPMVSRVHSVDTNYGLDDDALAAISGGGIGDGGSELGDNDGESTSGGANSRRPSPVTTPATTSTAGPLPPPVPPSSTSNSPRFKASTTTTAAALKKPPPRIPAAEALPPRLRSTSSSRKTSVSTSSGGESDGGPLSANEEYEQYDEELPDDRIRLGICAMDKKARSKPMAEILSRLDENLFHVVFFGDEVILNAPIEDWPICHGRYHTHTKEGVRWRGTLEGQRLLAVDSGCESTPLYQVPSTGSRATFPSHFPSPYCLFQQGVSTPQSQGVRAAAQAVHPQRSGYAGLVAGSPPCVRFARSVRN